MADKARRHEARRRREWAVIDLAERLIEADHATVSDGPFRGLAYPVALLPRIDAPVAKLVGAYECEIDWIFRAAIARGVGTFIDVGSADGYYAVGMALASPRTVTHAFELSGEARSLCAQVARANGVGARVRQARRFGLQSLDALDLTDALLLCDVEGAEAELFQPALVARLARAQVVVEVHEFARPGTGARLSALFAASHEESIVFPGPRPADDHPRLRGWSEAERAVALHEPRDVPTFWALYTPRAP
jgi:hypothetical protein